MAKIIQLSGLTSDDLYILVGDYHQCSGSVTFWYGSVTYRHGSGCGSESLFRQWPSRPHKKNFYPHSFLKAHLHQFSKIKGHKEVTKQKKSRFFCNFLLVDGKIQEAQNIRYRSAPWTLHLSIVDSQVFPLRSDEGHGEDYSAEWTHFGWSLPTYW